MSGRNALARHSSAGRLLGDRVAVRAAAPKASDGPVESALFEAPFTLGASELGPLGLELRARGEDAALELDATLWNPSAHEVQVEAVILGFRWQGVDVSALRFLRHGWQSWSWNGSAALDEAGTPPFPSGAWLRGLHHGLSAPAADREGWHESELLTIAGDDRAACCVGLLEAGHHHGLVYLKRDGSDVRVEVEIRLEVPLAPEARRSLEPVAVSLGSDANALLETHAERHGRSAGARTGAAFQAGWCTWYHYFHEIDEATLLRNLEALAGSREAIPIDLVQLDDGYQRATGDWLLTNEKFPRGLEPIAHAIRDAGFRAGLWTAPFCVVRESRVFEQHEDWLLRSGDALHRGLPHPQWTKQLWVHVLDTSREDVCAHLTETFAALTEMGFVYEKLDFLYTVAMAASAGDPAVTRAERLRRGLDAIRRGVGEDVFLLGCGCPLGAAVGAVDGMRIGPDVAPYWEPRSDPPIPGIEETVPSARGAIRSTLTRASLHRRLWLNDPDCLIARSRESDLRPDEATSLAGAIAATGGMVVFSDDVPALSEADRGRIRETIRLAREVDAGARAGTARPEGLLAREIPDALRARTQDGDLVLLLNAQDETRQVAGGLGLDSEPEAAALLGSHASRFDGLRRAELPAHASALSWGPRPTPLAVFCDFDGTFAVQDVGSTLAKRYAGDRRAALWERLSAGELDAWSYNEALLDGLELPEETLEAFLRTVELAPGAGELVAWCETRGVPFRVLSDGFDRNLDRLQELSGVRFAYDANRLWYDRGRWRLAAGAPDPTCSCGTGICKRARIQRFRRENPGARAVHVGNGRVSDLCASLEADHVFAKDTLAEELADRGVAFEPFADLHDVIEGLEPLWAGLRPAGERG